MCEVKNVPVFYLSGNTIGNSTVPGKPIVFQGGANITLSGTGSTIIISGGAGGGGAAGTISAGTTNMSVGGVSFADGNGISFGVNGQTLTASYTVPTQSNQTLGVYFVGNTTGQSSSSTYDARTLSIDGGGIVSAGWSAGSIRISATQSNQVASGSNGSFTFQTLTFSNANGLSFGTSAGNAITASYTVPTQTNQTGGIYAVGNTTGQSSSSTYDARTLSVDGAGIVSVGWSNSTLRVSATQSNQAFSAAGGSSAFQTLSFSDNANASWTNNAGQVAITSLRASIYATSNTTQSSTGTQNVHSLIFAGAGIASVGITNGSVVVSVPAGGGGGDGGVFAGVSNLGNTAGSTGTVSTGNFVLAGSNGISLSQSTAAAGSHATVTIYNAPPLQEFDPYKDRLLVAGQVGQGSLHINPVNFPYAVQHDRVGLRIIFSNTSNSSGSGTFSFWMGMYTRNVSTLSLLSSTSTSVAVTMSGTAGSYSQFGGNRLLTIPWTNTLQISNYWIGVISSTATAGANMSISQQLVSEMASTYSGIFGAASNASDQKRLGEGHYSVITGALPASIPFTDIRGNSSLFHRAPAVYFLSQTA